MTGIRQVKGLVACGRAQLDRFVPENGESEAALGAGEISAVLEAMGPSEIRETGYPGVWLVTHFNVDRQLMGKFIEITRVPDLLKSQDVDIADGLQRLAGQFVELQ